MSQIVIRDFSKQTDFDFVLFVYGVLWKLLNNPHFSSVTPTLDQLTIALDALKQEVRKSLAGDHQAQDKTAEKRAELERMMKALADDLEKTAAGDRAKLATSGFDLLASD